MSRAPRRPEHRGLRRYLLDDERIVIAMHQHWGKVAEPVATTLATLVPVVWLDTAMPLHARVVANLAWWAWLAVVGRMTWRLLQWRHDWFVATDRRLILTYGMLTHKVAMMPLMKVTDMSYSRSPMGRLLGYGRFLMESAGQEQALRKVSWVPHPDRTYRAICAEMFGGGDETQDDTLVDEAGGDLTALPGADYSRAMPVRAPHERDPRIGRADTGPIRVQPRRRS